MDKIINEIYYMLLERISQECARNDEVKVLRAQRCKLIEEITLRLGEDGIRLIDSLSDLNADLESIEDKVMFRVAVQLGTELARPGAGAGR